MTGGQPIRVALADDSAFVRRAFRRILAREPDLEVVGEAEDGQAALELCRRLVPDVLLLDLGMPVLDGISTLKQLRRQLPSIAVVVVSAAAQRGAEVTLIALEVGAFDFVDKAAVKLMELHDLGGTLIDKIRAAALLRTRPAAESRPAPRGAFLPPEALVMAASTGGPPALVSVLSRLPAALRAPVAVVQHIPASFVAPLAERVAQSTDRPVHIAESGARLQEGAIYFFAGGVDFGLKRLHDGLALVSRSPAPESPHVPSADTLFHSAAACCGARAWGVLLTGMGRDGADGLLSIRRAGGLTLAQDEATSTVYGMPKVARDIGAAFAVVALHEIPGYLAGAMGVDPETTGACTGHQGAKA